MKTNNFNLWHKQNKRIPAGDCISINVSQKTREIKNDIRNVNFNSELWMLMEAFRTNRHFKVR